MSHIDIRQRLEEWSQEYGHSYHPPASSEQIEELEFVLGTTLPSDYREFVLNCADGGTNGYDVLVSSKEQIEHYLDEARNIRLRRAFPFTLQQAKALAESDEAQLDLPKAVWDGKQFGEDGLDGTLVIQHNGYVGSSYLIVRGELAGRICFTGDGIAGIHPFESFTEWLVCDEWSYNCG
ncbi:MAG: SMI1/KNR4 family protein [Planctomycetota bacterium]